MVSPRVCPPDWHHQGNRPSSLLSYAGAQIANVKKKAESRKIHSGKIRRLSTWPPIEIILYSRINFRLYFPSLSLNL